MLFQEPRGEHSDIELLFRRRLEPLVPFWDHEFVMTDNFGDETTVKSKVEVIIEGVEGVCGEGGRNIGEVGVFGMAMTSLVWALLKGLGYMQDAHSCAVLKGMSKTTLEESLVRV